MTGMTELQASPPPGASDYLLQGVTGKAWPNPRAKFEAKYRPATWWRCLVFGVQRLRLAYVVRSMSKEHR